MTGKLRAIEITFPQGVDVTDADLQEIIAIVSRICDRYEGEKPHRVMWPFGMGLKMLMNPLALSDDQPIPFDQSTFSIECSERENYDWPCAKCGITQGDHKGCITDPPAGDCEFEPATKLQAEPAKGSA